MSKNIMAISPHLADSASPLTRCRQIHVLSEFFTNVHLGTSSPVHLGISTGSITSIQLVNAVCSVSYELWVQCLQPSVRFK